VSRLNAAKAEVAYLELEDEFLKAKERFYSGGQTPAARAKYEEVKSRFHNARVAYRQARETTAGDGDAVATPSTARASASVQK
jgi:hypothetical protein